MNVKIIDRPERPIETIYRAFRVCYSKDVPTEIEIPQKDFYPKGATEPLCKVSDNKKMVEFIKDKMNLGHESPLEHASFTFAIEGVSRALSHQLVRHRIASYSQQSQRYCKLNQFEYVIPPEIEKDFVLKGIFINHMEDSQLAYERLVKKLKSNGRTEKEAIEDARYVFPNACCTNLVVTMNGRGLRNFLSERTCKMAQWEIRELANKMLEEAEKIIPFVGYKAKKCGVTCFQCKVGD